jgi:quercetin dioxygenase-like cupin family protein
VKRFNIADMKGGWFIGDFTPAVLKTKGFEVCYKVHPKGEVWDKHYHKEAEEINYLIRGEMKINSEIVKAGEIFVFEKGEVCDPTFLTECELIVVKVPSVIGDKYIVER